MSTDKELKQLVVNKLTQQQFDELSTNDEISETEWYAVVGAEPDDRWLKTDVSNLTAAGQAVIAGIAADSVNLEGLADTDLSNLTAAGKEQIADLSKPSGRRVNLTFPNSEEADLIMPAAGHLVAYTQNTAASGISTWITLIGTVDATAVIRDMDKGSGTATLVAVLEVSKGMSVKMLTSGNFQSSANKYLWFTYAEGAN